MKKNVKTQKTWNKKRNKKRKNVLHLFSSSPNPERRFPTHPITLSSASWIRYYEIQTHYDISTRASQTVNYSHAVSCSEVAVYEAEFRQVLHSAGDL